MPILTRAEFEVIQIGDPQNPTVQRLLRERRIELSDDPKAMMKVVVDGLPVTISVYREDLGTIHQEA